MGWKRRYYARYQQEKRKELVAQHRHRGGLGEGEKDMGLTVLPVTSWPISQAALS